jgi:hypothetical protein
MKRFLVPAVFVIHANSSEEANIFASLMQDEANKRAKQIIRGPTNYLMLDEKLPNKEVPIVEGETEIPGTYVTNAGCDVCGSNDRLEDQKLCKDCLTFYKTLV